MVFHYPHIIRHVCLYNYLTENSCQQPNTVLLLTFNIFAIFVPWNHDLLSKILNFAGVKFHDFLQFLTIFYYYKYDTDTCISHISNYSKKIRVSVTYLILTTLPNYRKIYIQWDFCFLFLLKSCKKYLPNVLQWLNREVKYPQKVILC